MLSLDPLFARSYILRVFNHAQVYLFLGAAITTIGLLSASFSLLRRRLDPLLLWLALLAILYGVRLSLRYQLLWELQPRPEALERIVVALLFLIPIPAFFFFRELELLGQGGRMLSSIVWPVALCLSSVTLVFGPRHMVHVINNAFINTALLVALLLIIQTAKFSLDAALVRSGLFVFIACTIFDNITALVGNYHNIAPFSFMILLTTLGVVAARRTLASEQKLATLHSELEVAKQIQISILPSVFPESECFRVAARMVPMNLVGGDFYDFPLTNNLEIGLLIADVSGHGIPAALIGSMVKLAASSQRLKADDPSEFLSGMNVALLGNTQHQFVTAGYVYLDASSQEFRYSAAAHPPMLLLRHGVVQEFTENGLMLALFETAIYATLTQPIQPGDRLVLYTDGLLEARNMQEEEFGSARLKALVHDTGSLPLPEAVNEIIATVQRWSQVQTDDLTVVLCDYIPLISRKPATFDITKP
jgi:sigma-B regulation protein RsbU (phosphoserine phosphatase)